MVGAPKRNVTFERGFPRCHVVATDTSATPVVTPLHKNAELTNSSRGTLEASAQSRNEDLF